MNAICLDHIAIGLPRAEDAAELFEERLGGAPAGGYDGVPFGFKQWEFAGGGRIEVVYPMGPPNGFLHRFLVNGGPRVHHVTFKVPSLDATLRARRVARLRVVGSDRSDPHWQEAFLHPKQAQGIVVQMVEQKPRPGGEDWPVAAAAQRRRARARAAPVGEVRRRARACSGSTCSARPASSRATRWCFAGASHRS